MPADRSRDRGPSPQTGLIVAASPPEHMSEAAQQVWRGVVEVLGASGVLRDVDLLAVEMLCEAYADFSMADQELRNNWIMVTRSDGSQVPVLSRYTFKIDGFGNRIQVMHPAYAAKREASTAIRHWLNELGMTPAARARILGSVHGLPAGERPDSGEGALPIGDLGLGDLDETERASMRELLQRRLTGSTLPAPEDVETTDS